ncbi:unnamed protein product [Rhizophagus irregularis]|nr:unnamed protein product [Rhizophagus irregularis]
MSSSEDTEDSEHLNDPDFLSNSASKFTPRDARSLRVRFRSAENVGEVIPQIMPVNRVNVPQAYILQGVNRNLLQNQDINVVQLSQDNYVRTFINKLHKVVKNAELDIGTSESLTDTLVAHLLFRVFDFDQWPLGIDLHPKLKFKVGGDLSLKAIPEFVVRSHNYILLAVEDKHLQPNGRKTVLEALCKLYVVLSEYRP